MKILNLGCGKIDLDRFIDAYASSLVVNVDRYFTSAADNIEDTETNYEVYSRSGVSKVVCCKSDIFEFLDSFKYKFDLVIAERIFEHMEYVSGEIGRLLEAINTATFSDARLEIVVPNSIRLAKMLIDYEKNSINYNHIQSLNKKLIINSEFTNIRQDPHLSVWTPTLAKEYIESEGTWKIITLQEKYFFEGRSIYMNILCRKVLSAEINK
jgi:hypothetical protein